MKRWRIIFIALLAGVTVMPVLTADKEKSNPRKEKKRRLIVQEKEQESDEETGNVRRYQAPSSNTSSSTTATTNSNSSSSSSMGTSSSHTISQQKQEKHILHMNLMELVDLLHAAEDADSIERVADAMISFLIPTQDKLQAELAHYRKAEQEGWIKQAESEGIDYTRIHTYTAKEHLPGTFDEPGERYVIIDGKRVHSGAYTAKLAFEDPTLKKHDIHRFEELLHIIHELMARIEQIRQIKLAMIHSHDKKSKSTQEHYLQLLVELSDQAEVFEAMFGAGSKYGKEHMSGGGINLATEDLNTPDLSHCPDKLIVGKRITTILPRFNTKGWKIAMESVGMRTGHSEKSVATIRLQDRLWNIFPSPNTPKITSYQPPQPYWNAATMQWVQPSDNTFMTILPRPNLKAKLCEYQFQVVEHDPIQAMHHPWMMRPAQKKTTYTMVFVPAPEGQTMAVPPFSAVEAHLAEEVEAENVTSLHDEIRERFAQSKGNLKPSEVKGQAYGRVHVPDYRYGRVYERTVELETRKRTTKEQQRDAQHNRDQREEGEREQDRHEYRKRRLETGRSSVPQ